MDPNPKVDALTDNDLETMIELFVDELGRRDYKRARLLLTRKAIEMIDRRVEAKGG